MSKTRTLEDEIADSVTSEPQLWDKADSPISLRFKFKMPPQPGPRFTERPHEIEIGWFEGQEPYVACNGYDAPLRDPDKIRDSIAFLRDYLGAYHAKIVKESLARRREEMK